jgi:hypothetical protein
MPQIKDTGSSDTSLTGTELIPFQEAAGGAGSTKHTTAAAIAALATLGLAGVLPTSDPHVLHQLWNNLGVVNVSAG